MHHHRSFTGVLPLALISTLIAASGLQAEDLPRTISVTGIGKVSMPPDIVTIRTGVTTTAATAKEALKANNVAMKKLMNLLKNRSIADRDIQTSGFGVYPEYQSINQGPGKPRLREVTGYRVNNNVTMKRRALSDIGDLLDQLVSAGSNQISGVWFGLENPGKATDAARKKAIKDALSRAELYAHATGTQVGKVISISEQAIQSPLPQPRMMRAMAAESSVPVAAGEQEVSATIHVVYELIDRVAR